MTQNNHLRILVADNEEVVRELFARYLGNSKHTVDLAASGSECLKQMADASYDLVFLDLVMPDVDGETALARMRRKYPDTHVVVVSSQDDDRVISHLLGQGATAYLTKPFTREHVVDVVRKVERARVGDEVE